MTSPWHPDTWPRRKRGCLMVLAPLLAVVAAVLVRPPRRDHNDDGCLFVFVLLVPIPIAALVLGVSALDHSTAVPGPGRTVHQPTGAAR